MKSFGAYIVFLVFSIASSVMAAPTGLASGPDSAQNINAVRENFSELKHKTVL
ncbi:hypothetical protein FRC20_010127 [Serendipita sp. 405]|nr:hypothetical protein FRC20_010127 [Serendipita sp. 405]